MATIVEAHLLFKVFLDKLDSEAYPEILPEEIDIYLNEAQKRFVKTRYGQNNIYHQGFEQLQKRTEDLKNLVVTKFVKLVETPYSTLTDSLVIKRADLIDLYTDEALETEYTGKYMFYLKSKAYVCRTDTALDCCRWTDIKLIQQDDVWPLTNDPFNKPTASHVVGFFEEGGLMIWAGSNVDIDNIMITFIKEPVDVVNDLTTPANNVTFELSDHTHEEIIQMAVTIALENLESVRTESQLAVNENKSE